MATLGDWYEVLPVWLGLITVALTTACNVACLATPTWATNIEHPHGTPDVIAGLWEYCVDHACHVWDFSAMPAWWHSVLVLCTLSTFFLVCACIFSHLLAFCRRDSVTILHYIIACLIAAFFCLLPALMVFGFRLDGTDFVGGASVTLPHLVTSWGYHLGYLSIAGMPASLFFFCVDMKRISSTKSAYYDLDMEHAPEDCGSTTGLVDSKQ